MDKPTTASPPNAPSLGNFDDEPCGDDDSPPDIRGPAVHHPQHQRQRSANSATSYASIHEESNGTREGRGGGGRRSVAGYDDGQEIDQSPDRQGYTGFFGGHVPDGVQRVARVFSSLGGTVNRKLFPRAYGRHPANFVELPQADDASEIGSFSKTATCMEIFRSMLFASWLNCLLFFVPLGFVAYYWEFSPIVTFTLNVIAVVPLSALLTEATERIASDAGDTLGALLNISLGNFVELIIFVALLHDHIRIVQASILGSILVNLLLILGSALVSSAFCGNDAAYNSGETQLLSCLLFVSVFVFMMPTAFDYTFDHAKGADHAIIQMSRISAVLVLMIYVLYFVHELRTRAQTVHAAQLDSLDAEIGRAETMELPEFARTMSAGSATVSHRTIRFADDDEHSQRRDGGPDANAAAPIEMGAVETGSEDRSMDEYDDEDEDELSSRGRDTRLPAAGLGTRRSYDPLIASRGQSRSISVGSSRGNIRDSSIGNRSRRSGLTTLQILHDNRTNLEHVAHERPDRERTACDRFVTIGMLFVSSMLMSACAEFLVSTIDEVIARGHLSKSIIGLIILPIVGNLAEYITVVTVAVKEKLDLAIAVAVGSAIQIALCVTPLTIIAGWVLRKDLALTFNVFELTTLLGGVLLVNLLILNDGGSNLRASGLKGALMCACYVIIGLGSYLSPEGETN